MRETARCLIERVAIGTLSVDEAIRSLALLLQPEPKAAERQKAENIIRTEVLRMKALTAQARMMENAATIAGFGSKLQKQWLAASDSRVRAAHREAQGQVREVDEPFDVGGEKLMYPRDPSGSRENTELCRCVASSIISRPDRTR